ncbi:hypothetical protein GQ651_07930 [Alphaproteobacteria bacterium GH1-50]|uniref:Uncharacterized protein n=1 Tax=Kangsaoukella pontilimi TaxID=2691042 RepID=A0A7C9MA58_9RHOB|nr:hypothetical protein [Kangsaoukella pontilimi]MXQ07773.1 hypothetical protein [Kangsaoukella pontilimi]
MPKGSNFLLALSTLIAAIFVGAQAWIARTALVEASETRLLEKKLDICFENFDAATALDAELRALTPGVGEDEEWPPSVSVMEPQTLVLIQSNIVPLLNQLESSLAKATILGEPDRFRLYLAGQAQGLSQQLMMISPARLDEPETEAALTEILDTLSEFLGAQYSVFEGCSLVAAGDA